MPFGRAARPGFAAVLALAAAAPAAAQPPSLASCDAEGLRGYIGRPVTELQRVRATKARYVCQGCPMTMELRPDRLTVTYHEATKRIVELRCF